MYIVKDTIFKKHYSGWPIIRFSEFPLDLLPILPTDIIDIERVEEFYSENNSWDAHTIFKIYREREENEEEKTIRLDKMAKDNALAKARRYEKYLQLKKEFENEGPDAHPYSNT